MTQLSFDHSVVGFNYAYMSSTLHSPRNTLTLLGDPQLPSAIRTLSFADMCAIILYIISICKIKRENLFDMSTQKVSNEMFVLKELDVTSSGAWQRSAISSSVSGSTGSLQLQAAKEGLVYKTSLSWQRFEKSSNRHGLVLTWLH